MAERNAAIEPPRRMQFRVGINIGDVVSSRSPATVEINLRAGALLTVAPKLTNGVGSVQRLGRYPTVGLAGEDRMQFNRHGLVRGPIMKPS
jgi:hypothetical protein